jgi:hypothetical protein
MASMPYLGQVQKKQNKSKMKDSYKNNYKNSIQRK